MTLETGTWLKQFVDPQLLSEFKNYKDDFIATLTAAPKASIDTDGIKFNKLTNTIGFNVNKSTAFTPVTIPHQKGLIGWDKLDTDLTTVTDAELRAMPFDKDSAIKKMHSDSWKIGIRNYVMWKLAPAANAANMPVVRTTGADVAIAGGQTRKRMTINDLVNFIASIKTLNLPDAEKYYMILCAEHEADLLLERNDKTVANRGDLVVNSTTGRIERLYELKFFTNNQCVTYTTGGALKAQGAAAVATDRNASVFYYAPNTVYHIEKVMSLYTPMEQATRTADPQADYRLHCYGLCDKNQDYGFGAIVSAVV